jgi:hypothetical protein
MVKLIVTLGGGLSRAPLSVYDKLQLPATLYFSKELN